MVSDKVCMNTRLRLLNFSILLILAACLVYTAKPQRNRAFGMDGVYGAIGAKACRDECDVRTYLQEVDPELADAIVWPDRSVPALLPISAEQYIAEREIILTSAAKRAGFVEVVRAALQSGYNLTASASSRLRYEENAPAPDTAFSLQAYLDEHQSNILPYEMPRYYFVRSSLEAEQLEAELLSLRRAKALLRRRLAD